MSKRNLRIKDLIVSLQLGFPGGSAGKESTCNAGDLGSIAGLGRSPGEDKGYPLQYSGLENSIDYTVHGVAKGWTQLSDVHFLSNCFHFFFPKSENVELSREALSNGNTT